MALAGKLLPWLYAAAVLVLAYGLYLSFAAPEDYQQGTTVRIMYIHVPFAWISMMCYSVMAVAAVGTLVWRHPLADVSLKPVLETHAIATEEDMFDAIGRGRLAATKIAETMDTSDYGIVTGADGYVLKFRLLELWGELMEQLH